jgi:predicted Zn-dependent protease
MRVLSDVMKDQEAQRLMLKLANDYDKLADRAEDRAARGRPLAGDGRHGSTIPKPGRVRSRNDIGVDARSRVVATK